MKYFPLLALLSGAAVGEGLHLRRGTHFLKKSSRGLLTRRHQESARGFRVWDPKTVLAKRLAALAEHNGDGLAQLFNCASPTELAYGAGGYQAEHLTNYLNWRENILGDVRLYGLYGCTAQTGQQMLQENWPELQSALSQLELATPDAATLSSPDNGPWLERRLALTSEAEQKTLFGGETVADIFAQLMTPTIADYYARFYFTDKSREWCPNKELHGWHLLLGEEVALASDEKKAAIATVWPLLEGPPFQKLHERLAEVQAGPLGLDGPEQEAVSDGPEQKVSDPAQPDGGQGDRGSSLPEGGAESPGAGARTGGDVLPPPIPESLEKAQEPDAKLDEAETKVAELATSAAATATAVAGLQSTLAGVNDKLTRVEALSAELADITSTGGGGD
mmetsp:Transcript_9097/g.22268  ORF Transcript_9097/g.22268 Transcript_9097/m.22268 type:complete len:392 (-) Transcript_9097:1445-2620(-)|eukprot:CAMPEP_0178987208 /NCGR_PEP_ID=MMETSP0795-20121207/3136_1 /TAXON_ID=88552 /ORGANISM="Amoebophrya sp., Strain Ameob2" /LENGTH=391 /DNA_ID=CAMNT_0020678363 /DNA_START=1116 /DNA_END=2291 /DNA_ORIENTATION=+